ncbi:hypothetical protein IWX64_000715 [Arthrobacter sp. CAN_A212]
MLVVNLSAADSLVLRTAFLSILLLLRLPVLLRRATLL